jgi:gingipain R
MFFFEAETWASENTDEINTSVLKSTDTSVVVKFEIKDFKKDLIMIDNLPFYKIGLTGEATSSTAGEPELPKIFRNIIIPSDCNMKIRVLSSKYRDFEDTPVSPSKGIILRNVEPDSIPYKFGKEYKNNTWFPEKLVSLGQPFILREYHGIGIELNAFFYNPVKKVLRVYESVTVEVYNDGTDLSQSSANNKRLSRYSNVDFETIYSNTFINYNFQTTKSQTRAISEKGSMLIIVYDEFYDAMLPFVQWKKQIGIPVKMVKRSLVSPGNKENEIKSFVKNYYTENPDLCYLLLVGDMAQVTSPMTKSNTDSSTVLYPGDIIYGKVAGNDNYPDLLVGRFSAERIADVETQVERTISYESNVTNDDYYSKTLGIASDESNGFESDRQHISKINKALLSFTYTYADTVDDKTVRDVTEILNSGRGFINYCGHGVNKGWTTTKFSNNNIEALSNTGKYPFIYSVACLNGQFNVGTCFAEAWLRSRTPDGKPIGAVGAFMSSISQPWIPPMEAQDSAVELLCSKTNVTLGGLCINSTIKMITKYGSDGSDTADHWILFGDPSLKLITGIPKTMSLSASETISPDATSYEINNAPSGALCTLYYNDTIYGSAYADSTGSARIPISESLPRDRKLKLTVTAFNYIPVIKDIPVSENGLPSPTPTSNSGITLSGYIKPDLTLSGSSAEDVYSGFRVEIDGLLISAQTDKNGYFELTNVPADSSSYTLTISKVSYLKRKLQVALPTRDIQLSTFDSPIDVWAGDIPIDNIQDNAINISDIQQLAVCFNTTYYDMKFNPDVDLNKDGAVNISDAMIIAKHFNTSSSSYPVLHII